MDVDEQIEQSAGANNASAPVSEQEIASSSSGVGNSTVIESSKGNDHVPSNASNNIAKRSSMVMQDIDWETSNDSQVEQRQHEVRDANASPNVNEEERENDHVENVGINPNYPIVLVQRVNVPNPGNSPIAGTSADLNNEDSLAMDEDIPNVELGEVSSELNSVPAAVNDNRDALLGTQTNDENVPAETFNEEDHQNEQHIENAGIDPNYPLILVRRVSIPSVDDNSRSESLAENNNLDPLAMEDDINVAGAAAAIDGEGQDNAAPRRYPAEVLAALNSIEAGSDNEGEADEDEDETVEDVGNAENVEDVWSEEDDNEVAFMENPNFRGFANQFEAIRNMIVQTRRSMAEAEANFGRIPRNSLMQRFRRILFILNNRRRRLIRLGLATPDVRLPAVNAAMIGGNGDSTDSNDDHIVEGPPVDEANNLTMEQEEEMNENAVRFDTNLPAEHSYMGANMNRVSGVNYLEVDQYVKLRLFIHQHVLFPGEILPFMVDSSTTIIDGDIDAQNGILFGVCFPCLSINTPTANGDPHSTSSEDKDKLLYGVTCQIYELGEDNRGNTLIKSRALQRFVTKASDLTVPLEYINAQPRMKCFGFVKIMPDLYLPDPLKSINMGSMNRFRDNTSMNDMYKRFQAATTPWPAYVYETHNISNIIEKARTQLAQHKIDTMPIDPTQLSYWLVRNLHLPEDMMKSVFLANTVNTRLKLIASTFKEEAIFCCRNCVIHIADCRELFAMSKHGVQSQYCNSAGYIHETNTLYQVNRQNILYSGLPSTKFSWFPGYQWHIIVCKICKHHLGWEFKAVKPNLIPKNFFGISSSSVRVRLAQNRNDVPVQNAVYINLLRLMNAGMNELREARNNMPNI